MTGIQLAPPQNPYSDELAQALLQDSFAHDKIKSPLEGLGNLSEALVGAYLKKQSDNYNYARQQQANDALSNALSGQLQQNNHDTTAQVAGPSGSGSLLDSLTMNIPGGKAPISPIAETALNLMQTPATQAQGNQLGLSVLLNQQKEEPKTGFRQLSEQEKKDRKLNPDQAYQIDTNKSSPTYGKVDPIGSPINSDTGVDNPLLPDTLKTAALVVASDPTRIRDYATFGKMGQGIRNQINNAITTLKKQTGMSDADFIAARTRAHADIANAGNLTKQYAQIQAADQLARNNGERLLQLFDAVDQTGVPLYEGVARSARLKAGNVDVAEMKSVLTTFQAELARLLTAGPGMGGTVSDTARNELQGVINGTMSTDQAKRVLARIFTEMDIRKQAINEQLNNAVTGTVVGAKPSMQSQVPTTQTAPAQNDPLGIR